VNIVILHGRLGQDPELKFTQGGMAYLRMSVATDKQIKRNEQWEKVTQWHRVICWGKRAEGLAKKLAKGDMVMIHGELQYGSYEDSDGNKRYTTDIVLQEFEFGGSRGGGSQRDDSDNDQRSQQRSNNRSSNNNRSKEPPPPDDDFSPDNDIPF
jgi:single-strand DNA-binding protein